MHKLFFTHYKQGEKYWLDDIKRLNEFRRKLKPLLRKGIEFGKRDKSLYAEELDIISDWEFICNVGWTFTELNRERNADPYRVLVAHVYQTVKNEVRSQNQKEANKKMKSVGRKRGKRR